VLLAEVLVLAGVLVALWWNWQGALPDLLELMFSFARALPLALLTVYLVPALFFIVGAVVWEGARAFLEKEW
jgi:ABC-type methionine transport system permease subunit